MSTVSNYKTPDMTFDVCLPIEDPLGREAFFAERPPVAGLPPCRRLAIGCALLAEGYQQRGAETIEVLHAAWRAGFRLTDTARAYGDAEQMLGEAARRWSGQPPVITTKFGSHAFEPADLASQWAESLRWLEPARVSLVALHDTHVCRPEVWPDALSFLRARVADGSVSAAGSPAVSRTS